MAVDRYAFLQDLQDKGFYEPRYLEDGTPTDHTIIFENRVMDMLKGFEAIGDFLNGSSDKQEVFNIALSQGVGHRHLNHLFITAMMNYFGWVSTDEWMQSYFSDPRNNHWNSIIKEMGNACQEKMGYNPFTLRLKNNQSHENEKDRTTVF